MKLNQGSKKALEWTAVGIVITALMSIPKIAEGTKTLGEYAAGPDNIKVNAEKIAKLVPVVEKVNVHTTKIAMTSEKLEDIQTYIDRLDGYLAAQQQQAPIPKQAAAFREQDSEGYYWCCDAYNYERCWDSQLWYEC